MTKAKARLRAKAKAGQKIKNEKPGPDSPAKTDQGNWIQDQAR